MTARLLILLFAAFVVLLTMRTVDDVRRMIDGDRADRRRASRLGQGLVVMVMVLVLALFFLPEAGTSPDLAMAPTTVEGPSAWTAPDTAEWAGHPDADLLRYGRELIANTAHYLGPHGTVGVFSNGLNCQNCHLDAGTRPWGNNYGAVHSTYPRERARSGTLVTVEERINDCFQRSLNGSPLPEEGREMRAMVAYMAWLGRDVPRGERPPGTGIAELHFLDRAADPEKGRTIYEGMCASCHGADGQGMPLTDGSGYQYPPLWGPDSYNDGAGLYRLTRFAGFARTNMPFGVTHERPLLTEEQAWDVAAYVNTREHPHREFPGDWPDIARKPIDHPSGPFADPFPEEQHKLGPFGPIAAHHAVAEAR